MNKQFTVTQLIITLMTIFSLASCGVGTQNGQVLNLPVSSDEPSETVISANPSELRKITFDYIALDSLISELQKDPSWTDGELTMFIDNCRRFLLDKSPNRRTFIIVINESTGDVSINGRQDLHDIFKMMPTGFEMSNKSRLYRHVKSAIEEAKYRGFYNQIFKEIIIDH